VDLLWIGIVIVLVVLTFGFMAACDHREEAP
jgi:hypothetical protein